MIQSLRSILLSFTLIPLLLGSCTSLDYNNSGKVCHMVFCWLNEPGNELAKNELIKASNGFKNIPGVFSVSTGETLMSARPIVDTSYDLAIMIIFENKIALDQYLVNPIHKSAQQEVLKPNVKKVLIYDFAIK